MDGSPAVTIHNIPAPHLGSPTTTLTDTEDIIIDRENVANEIWNDRRSTKILFENTLSSSTLNFPQIPDTDTTLGVSGDILDPNVRGREVNDVIRRCHAAYESLGLPNIGITVININHFNNNMGTYTDSSGLFNVPAGYGGCDWHPFTALFSCSEGWLLVTDNFWMRREAQVTLIIGICSMYFYHMN